MSTDQDWTNVWPTATTFKQSVVPLPITQGYVASDNENKGLPVEKYANAELMKIPNFFHLTPNHIKKHCATIKRKFIFFSIVRNLIFHSIRILHTMA